MGALSRFARLQHDRQSAQAGLTACEIPAADRDDFAVLEIAVALSLECIVKYRLVGHHTPPIALGATAANRAHQQPDVGFVGPFLQVCPPDDAGALREAKQRHHAPAKCLREIGFMIEPDERSKPPAARTDESERRSSQEVSTCNGSDSRHDSSSVIRSPSRRANASSVSVGLDWPAVGKTEEPATYRFERP